VRSFARKPFAFRASKNVARAQQGENIAEMPGEIDRPVRLRPLDVRKRLTRSACPSEHFQRAEAHEMGTGTHEKYLQMANQLAEHFYVPRARNEDASDFACTSCSLSCHS
jgi:hypothetical protein